MSDYRKGDRVSWSSHGGTATGEVVRKITSDTESGGRTVRASAEEPQYLCAATTVATRSTSPRR